MHEGEQQNGYIQHAFLVSTYVKVTNNCNARKNDVEENESQRSPLLALQWLRPRQHNTVA